MKITVDTNVLVRILMNDDVVESPLAIRSFRSAEVIVLTLPMLCELVWVLGRGYKLPRSKIADAIRTIASSEAVRVDGAAVEAGLAIMDSGGDFADGIIAFEGWQLGGEVFVTFDKKAAKLIAATNGAVELLGPE